MLAAIKADSQSEKQARMAEEADYLWRLQRSERLFLRRKGKCTWVLLQEVNKVLN